MKAPFLIEGESPFLKACSEEGQDLVMVGGWDSEKSLVTCRFQGGQGGFEASFRPVCPEDGKGGGRKSRRTRPCRLSGEGVRIQGRTRMVVEVAEHSRHLGEESVPKGAPGREKSRPKVDADGIVTPQGPVTGSGRTRPSFVIATQSGTNPWGAKAPIGDKGLLGY